MEHLNDFYYFKYVFGWLTDTFEMLKKEDIAWKKENGFTVIEEEVKEQAKAT